MDERTRALTEALGALPWDTDGDKGQAMGQLLGVIEVARRLAKTPMTLADFADILEQTGAAEFGASWAEFVAQMRAELESEGDDA